MSIQVEWDNEQHTVVLCTFMGTWTWDELYAALDRGEEMAKDNPARVSAILDVRQGSSLPGGSFFNKTLLDQAQTLFNRAQTDRGQIAVVGASPFMRSMFSVASNLFGDKAGGMTFVDSIEEARRIVASTPAP
jgi:hypothetical protein